MYKKILRKYKERKILQSIFMGSFGISVLCIIISCMIGFAWFQKTSERESMERERRELSNYFLVLDNYISSAQDTLELLYKNVYVKRLIVSGDLSWNDNMSVVANNVLNTVSVNPRLHSIYIFGNQEILLKSSNHSYPLTLSQDDEMRELFRDSSMKHYNLLSYNDVYGKEREILSLSMGEFSTESKEFMNGVMVNLDIGTIADEIFSEVGKNENYLIVDSYLNVMGSKGEGYSFNQILSNHSLMKAIKKDNKEQNTLKIKREDGKIYTVSYLYSKQDGYYIIHTIPYQNFIMPIQKTRSIVIITGILMAFVALTISFMVALKVYHPIDEVVDTFQNPKDNKENERRKRRVKNELTTISQTMAYMVSQLNQFYEMKEQEEIVQYLIGKNADVVLPEYFTEAYEGREENCNFQVIVLRICDVDDFVINNTKEAIDFQLQTVSNMIVQTMHEFGEIKTIRIDQEYIAVILFYEHFKNNSIRIEDEVHKFLLQVDELLSIQLDAGLSQMRHRLSDLREAYQSARAATSYRFLYGMKVVVGEEQMQRSALGGKVDIDTTEIMEAVKTRNLEMFKQHYQEMAKSLRGCSIQVAYEILISLAISMNKYHSEITKHSKEIKISKIESIRKEVMSFHYIEDATNWFIDLFGNISDSVSKVQNSGSADIVSNAISYIEEHYMDVNISAQFLASKFNITPSYFSRIFNEICTCAFPDYLSGYRLEKAKQMLIESPNKSIQQICEEVGYTSSSYFTAMFKKKYGITPSKYRATTIE